MTSPITIAAIWHATSDSPPLTTEQIEKLAPYITRYAQTMRVSVHAVGGFVDHLHLVFDLGFDQSVGKINGELQKTTARFLRESLQAPGFSWGDTQAVGVSPSDVETVTEYIQRNAERHQSGQIDPAWENLDTEDTTETEEALPDWLRQALDKSENG